MKIKYKIYELDKVKEKTIDINFWNLFFINLAINAATILFVWAVLIIFGFILYIFGA